MLEMLICIMILCVSFGIIVLSLVFVNFVNIYKEELRFKRYELEVKTPISEDDFKLLDIIIEECFKEYIILKVEYMDAPTVNSDDEKRIVKGVAEMVADRMSSTIQSKLSLVYNEDNLPKIMSERIYLYTLDYFIKKNSVK